VLDEVLQQYADSLARSHTDVIKLDLRQLTRSKWDSVLVLSPYVPASNVRALDIANYAAIREAVNTQAFQESTATLAFVQQGSYVAYAVVSRNPISFVNIPIGVKAQFVWLTRKDCDNLYVRKCTIATGTYNQVEHIVPNAKPNQAKASLDKQGEATELAWKN
jgi:hypothetical protein